MLQLFVVLFENSVSVPYESARRSGFSSITVMHSGLIVLSLRAV